DRQHRLFHAALRHARCRVRHAVRAHVRHPRFGMKRVAALVALLASFAAHAALPRAVARAFLDAGVPLSSVAIVVAPTGTGLPLFTHQPSRPMTPASVMKLVTTLASLEILGRDYRFHTDAYLRGRL